jgi:putative tricarboxylic transport membrane protein
MKCRRADAVIGVLLIILSTAVYTGTYDFARQGVGVGPQFVPRMLALFMIFLSAIMILSAFLRKPVESDEIPAGSARQEFKMVGIALAAVILYVLLLNGLGFRLATILYLSGMLLFLGERSPGLIAAWSLGIAFGIYWVFQDFLGVDLPQGRFIP